MSKIDWKKVAKHHFHRRTWWTQLGAALRLAEEALSDKVDNKSILARTARDAIGPFAVAFTGEVPASAVELVEVHMAAREASLRARAPHWAMYMIGQSLAASMMEAPNYQTAILSQPGNDGLRFEVVLRQIGKGKTAHELRAEAEAEVDRLKKEVERLEKKIARFEREHDG